MSNKVVTKTYAPANNQILFMTQPYAAVGVVVTNTGVSADSDGKKILKAGTPIYGSLEARTTAFVKETTTEGVSNAVAVLVHDVDVTAGAENASALIFGFVDLNKLDTATAALITSAVKTALAGKITFLK